MLLSIGALLVPTASADGGARDCVYVAPNGDITVSPSGCAEAARPVVEEVDRQCDWVVSNPAFPPGTSCNLEEILS